MYSVFLKQVGKGLKNKQKKHKKKTSNNNKRILGHTNWTLESNLYLILPPQTESLLNTNHSINPGNTLIEVHGQTLDMVTFLPHQLNWINKAFLLAYLWLDLEDSELMSGLMGSKHGVLGCSGIMEVWSGLRKWVTRVHSWKLYLVLASLLHATPWTLWYELLCATSNRLDWNLEQNSSFLPEMDSIGYVLTVTIKPATTVGVVVVRQDQWWRTATLV